eukprot:scpid97016/ scgid35119/ 
MWRSDFGLATRATEAADWKTVPADSLDELERAADVAAPVAPAGRGSFRQKDASNLFVASSARDLLQQQRGPADSKLSQATKQQTTAANRTPILPANVPSPPY